MSHVRYFSMFSGIGGFELGINQAAHDLGITTECVGSSDPTLSATSNAGTPSPSTSSDTSHAKSWRQHD